VPGCGLAARGLTDTWSTSRAARPAGAIPGFAGCVCHGAGVSFAVLSVVAIGFVFKFLPETKGRSVEEVVQIFEKQAEASKVPV
jgi:Sugar (and other) transporter